MLGSLPHARKERAGVAFLCRKRMELLFRTLSLHSRMKLFFQDCFSSPQGWLFLSTVCSMLSPLWYPYLCGALPYPDRLPDGVASC